MANTPPFGATTGFTKGTSPRPASPYLNSKEAAEYVRLSYNHFKALQASGMTPAIGGGRRGMRVLYTLAGLDRWLQTRTVRTGRPWIGRRGPALPGLVDEVAEQATGAGNEEAPAEGQLREGVRNETP